MKKKTKKKKINVATLSINVRKVVGILPKGLWSYVVKGIN